ncbi:uncharacterized protein MEPE_02436 [Melanopsichium pennsylvanicum]|uniref:Uncharacterized protein n=1 Tax=Melanopsichium pennsylvanicum TaxID=63383 RepID=A0AAJ5C4P4_9BASI|nr:uncharacterized protein MEPE_02436 [Melanopsichium pennsylvanicum]
MNRCTTGFLSTLGFVLLFLSLVIGSISADQVTAATDEPRSDPGEMLSQLEENLYNAHSSYQTQQIKHLRSMDRSREAFDRSHDLMQGYFNQLSRTLQSKGAELVQLENINNLRRAGYRFGPETDPGLHVQFGTVWNYRLFGPYPSTRLAQAVDQEEPDKMRTEIDNAWKALDRQNWLESRWKIFKPAFTDDVDLLTSAIQYHEKKLEEKLKYGSFTDGLRKSRMREGLRSFIRLK